MQATSVCRTCDLPIFWALTDEGKFMPMNPHADATGNCWIDRYENGVPVVKVGTVPPAIALRYTSHWATCASPPPRHLRYAHEVRS